MKGTQLIADLQQKAQQFATENASVMLSAAGVVGTVGTALLTGRASFKAAELIQAETEKRQNDPESDRFAVQKKEAVAMTWPLFLPPIGVGGATIVAIVMANRIDAKKAAALAAAYGISERSLQEYKEKALEKLGVNKEQKLRDEIAQDQVNKNPDHQIIMVGDGEVLFYDQLTGRYFKSTVEKAQKALALVHSEIYKHMSASLTLFFEELGLQPTDYTDMVGWSTENIPDLEFSTTETPDNRPCMVLAFSNPPVPDYNRLHS